MSFRKLVVGLGNPGLRYSRTPHNLGFEVVDLLAKELKAAWRAREAEQSQTADGILEGGELMLAKPETYMNRSGEAVDALCRRHDFAVSDLIVVCDDLALPFGKIRIRTQGGAGGHNGLKSLIETLDRDDFVRVRLGIAPEVEITDAADYVLTRVPDSLLQEFGEMAFRAKDAVKVICLKGALAAMNQFN
ncbi:MAG: aminoacyl-tRNA hydrolase [Terriglobia bacterium]